MKKYLPLLLLLLALLITGAAFYFYSKKKKQSGKGYSEEDYLQPGSGLSGSGIDQERINRYKRELIEEEPVRVNMPPALAGGTSTVYVGIPLAEV